MGFVRPPVTSLAGTVLIVLALLMQVVGMSAPGWFFVRLGQQGDAMVGLWQYCHDQPKHDCLDVDNQWPVDAWLEASRAFSVLGLLTLLLCTVSAFLQCFLGNHRILWSLAPVSSLVAALFIFIEFSVFSGEVERRKNTRGQDFEYQYCFGLTIAAFLLALIAALLFFLASRRVEAYGPGTTSGTDQLNLRDKNSEYGDRNSEPEYGGERDRNSEHDERDRNYEYGPEDRNGYFSGGRNDKYGSREKNDKYGSKERNDKYGSREKNDKYGSEEMKDKYGSREKNDKTGSEEKRDKYGSREKNDKYGSEEKKDKYGSEEKDKYGSREKNDKYGSEEKKDKYGSEEKDKYSSEEKTDKSDSEEKKGKFGSRERNHKVSSRERNKRQAYTDKVNSHVSEASARWTPDRHNDSPASGASARWTPDRHHDSPSSYWAAGRSGGSRTQDYSSGR